MIKLLINLSNENSKENKNFLDVSKLKALILKIDLT